MTSGRAATAQTFGSHYREPVMTETTRRLARQISFYRKRASAARSRESNQRLAYRHLLQRLCNAVGVTFRHPPGWEYDQLADRIVAEALRLRADRAERKVVNPEQHGELTVTIHAVIRDASLDCGALCERIADAVISSGWKR